MEVYLLLKDLIDGEKERERIAKEKSKWKKKFLVWKVNCLTKAS